MANWKKPKSWAVIGAVLLCITVLVSCAVNPAGETTQPAEEATQPAGIGATAVTMGLKIPYDVDHLEYGEREKRFFPLEQIPGSTDTQFATTELLGGIRIYEAPEETIANMGDWLEAVGVPQVVSGTYEYIVGGSAYADMEGSFADAGGRETKHYFYIQGDLVFELWFDPSRLDEMTRAAILESVTFAPDAEIERRLPAIRPSESHEEMAAEAQRSEEEGYLLRCRTALEELQGQDSYTVKSHTNNYGGVILNDTSQYWFYKDGDDWLKLSQIPDEGFERGFWPIGYMCVDGKYYDNEEACWDDNENILWGESEHKPLAMPWITAFRWEEQDVLFVSKVPAGKGLCVTTQVMAPYRQGSEELYDYYQMQFIFNEYGNLDRIENTYFFHNEREGDYSSRETIQFLKGSPRLVIDQEYQRYLDQG